MGKKLQTIYEYFKEYSEKDIDDMIYNLSMDDKLVIRARFGNDLHHPTLHPDWNKENYRKYYNTVLPKMRKLLVKLSSSANEPEVEQESEIFQTESEIIDKTPLLLNLIKAGKTNHEMCDILKMTPNQLYEELLKLKNRGIRYSRKYYSDGVIKYDSITTMQNLKSYRDPGHMRTIITDTNENSMKLLAISDLHFGNELERIDLIDRAFNYCAKNGINIILCGGDFIDGSYSKGTQKITDLYQQMEYFIKNYPQDKNILTFGVGGDHDLSAFNKSSLELIEICENFRQDIIIGGYNNTTINLKNDKIHLYHHTPIGRLYYHGASIILHGHLHKYTTMMKNGTLNVTLPSLSNINQVIPSALELELAFEKGMIKETNVKQLYFDTEDVILGESQFKIFNENGSKSVISKNAENYRQSSMEITRKLVK